MNCNILADMYTCTYIYSWAQVTFHVCIYDYRPRFRPWQRNHLRPHRPHRLTPQFSRYRKLMFKINTRGYRLSKSYLIYGVYHPLDATTLATCRAYLRPNLSIKFSPIRSYIWGASFIALIASDHQAYMRCKGDTSVEASLGASRPVQWVEVKGVGVPVIHNKYLCQWTIFWAYGMYEDVHYLA